MLDIPNGFYVSGYLASDDISTAAAIPLFDGNGVSYTLSPGERLIIASVSINNGATASVVKIFADADGDGALDAGEELYAASLAAKAQASPNLAQPIYSRQIGATAAINKLFAIASASSVGTIIVLNGYVIKS